MSTNGLYFGIINSRDMFANNDWIIGDAKWNSLQQRRSSKAAKEESQGSNQFSSTT